MAAVGGRGYLIYSEGGVYCIDFQLKLQDLRVDNSGWDVGTD